MLVGVTDTFAWFVTVGLGAGLALTFVPGEGLAPGLAVFFGPPGGFTRRFRASTLAVLGVVDCGFAGAFCLPGFTRNRSAAV